MSKIKKVKGLNNNTKSKVITGVAVGLGTLALAGVLGVTCKVVTNRNTYTKEQYEQHYIDGYNDASVKEQLLKKQLEECKALNDKANKDLTSAQLQISNLEEDNNSKTAEINILNGLVSNYKESVKNLQTEIASNEELIAEYQSEIVDCEEEITKLEQDKENNLKRIEQLHSNIVNLQNLCSELQTTNDLNLKTISQMGANIVSLNTQISDLQNQINNNNQSSGALQSKIASLEKSIQYYETYISNLENDQMAVATFRYDNSVYNIQIVQKGTIASLVSPTDTDYIKFNHWTVNGEQIDLSTYTITENVDIVADCTYYQNVKFVIDGDVKQNYFVKQGENASATISTEKTGYEFLGWTLNGVDVVTLTNMPITNDITFIAKYVKLHTIQFSYEDVIVSTQTIRNGEYVASVDVENSTYKVFNGWKLNNQLIDIATYSFSGDAIVVADITYKYDVNFVVDGASYRSQIVALNDNAKVPTNPIKVGYKFVGWTIDGESVIDLSTYSITGTTTFVAKFVVDTVNVNFVVDNETYTTQSVTKGQYVTIPTTPTKTGYKFLGWTIDGENIIDLSNYTINSSVTFIAKFIVTMDGNYVFDLADGTMSHVTFAISNNALVNVSGLSTSYDHVSDVSLVNNQLKFKIETFASMRPATKYIIYTFNESTGNWSLMSNEYTVHTHSFKKV